MATHTTYSPPVFFNEDKLAYLKRYAPKYPSINRFKSMLETHGLIEFTTAFRFHPNKGSKHHCPSIYAYRVKGVYFIQSYQTIVGAICLNPHMFHTPVAFRLWDGNSRSTSKHITEAMWKLKDIITVPYRHIPYPNMQGPIADFDALLDLLATAEDFDPQESEWPYALS